jgi:hypothetical protein
LRVAEPHFVIIPSEAEGSAVLPLTLNNTGYTNPQPRDVSITLKQMFLSVLEIYELVRSLHFNNPEQILLAGGAGKWLRKAALHTDHDAEDK